MLQPAAIFLLRHTNQNLLIVAKVQVEPISRFERQGCMSFPKWIPWSPQLWLDILISTTWGNPGKVQHPLKHVPTLQTQLSV